MKILRKTGLLLLFTAVLCPASGMAAEELVVYTARKEHLIKPLFEAYTRKTGVGIKYVTDKAGPLLERLKAEGRRTPADVLVTVDAGNLWRAAESGLLQPVESATLEENVPPHFRDPGDHWFGFSVRARTIAYNPQKISNGELSTYEALGNPQWKGRLCLRTSKKVYNQSLVAMLMAVHGHEETEEIVRSWVENLAAEPFSSDTAVLEAIAAGQCDVGIVNTYYYGRLMKEDPSLPLALFWPNQDAEGVHVNISGGGVVRYSDNPEEAVSFLEWLSSAEAQNLFADANMEYPVNPGVSPHPAVAAWGSFKPNRINVSLAGELQGDAIRLMDRAGYR